MRALNMDAVCDEPFKAQVLGEWTENYNSALATVPPYPFDSTTGQGKFCKWQCPRRTAISWYDRLIKDIAPKKQTLVLAGKDGSPRQLCCLPPLCSTEHMCSITQQLIALEVSGDLNTFLIQRCPNSGDAASDVLQCKVLWPSAHGFAVCVHFFMPRRKKGRERHKAGQSALHSAASSQMWFSFFWWWRIHIQ